MPVTCSDETLILLYFPGRGSNSQPPAHRSFKHGQGVLRPYPLGHGGGLATCFGRKGRIPLEGVKATSWSTNDDITDAHISATIQQILTKFSAVVSYVKQRQIGKFQLICT